jgi:16S rRNA (cytosine1402-N4)-methyltransferase
MTDNDIHTPVNLERTIELLGPAIARDGAVLVDATLGMGGHSEALLTRFPGLTLVGIDRDTDALAIAGKRLEPFGDRVHLVHAVYDEIPDALARLGITEVAGFLFDLGVSSLQLDEVDRGFSYSKDAPLDMRMDATSPLTAERILAEYSEFELRRIFYDYGEEKLAPRYARSCSAARSSPSCAPPSSWRPSSRRRRLPCSARATRPSGCSRRCASR